MNNIAVIYKSKYGATKQYAQWLVQALDAPLFEASAIKPKNLMDYDLIIYGGGLYAGSINGISLVTKNPVPSLVVFTVGLGDPGCTDYSAVIKQNFPKGLPGGEGAKIFHLRGAIDYDKLGLLHKGILAGINKALAKKDKAGLSSEARTIVENYGVRTDFTDMNSITPIVEFVKKR